MSTSHTAALEIISRKSLTKYNTLESARGSFARMPKPQNFSIIMGCDGL